MFSPLCFFFSLQFVIIYSEDLYSKFYQHDYKLQFTRMELVEYNKDMFESYNVVTFKYNRSVAVANVTFKTKTAMDNNEMQIRGQAYKFYSNEYRTFPLRLQLNFCTCITRNLLGMKKSFTGCGNFSTDCYFKKGATYHICNFAPDPSRFPPLIPNGQYKLEITLISNNTVGVILNSYGTIDRPIKYN